ncbi:MAG: arylsulfatase A-like enzyme, partial [Verrucomicrobiales bacterium]
CVSPSSAREVPRQARDDNSGAIHRFSRDFCFQLRDSWPGSAMHLKVSRRIQQLLALLFCFLAVSTSQAQEKPNLLFIFADDQCFRTINSLNNDEVETPNLDRLAARSTTFTRAYNMGSWSGAVCVASRTMLNTGKYIWRANASNLKDLQEKGQLWSQLIGAAGYDTYFSGKWHVKADTSKIFKTARNVRPGMPNQTPTGYNRPIDGRPDPWDPSDPKFEGFWKGGKHWSEVLGDDAVEYLGTAAKNEAPFFMYLAFNAPHDPRQSPAEFVAKYPLENISMPPNFVPEYQWKEEMKSGKGLRDEKLAPFPRTENSVKVNRQEYYAIITHLDVQVGRMLDALEASGKADNTWIFYSADHGLAVGEHGLMGKQNMFEHSVRVPLMVSGPGVPKGAKMDSPVYLQDIMATTIDLADAEKPDHVEFQSLKPYLVDGGDPVVRSAIYGAYLDAQRMVTVGKDKLILYPKAKVAVLYDVAADPFETKDLAKNPENLPLMKKLFQQLLELQEDLDDKVDLKKVYPNFM